MKVLKLARNFIKNLLHLMRNESMLNVEGFIGGMFIIVGFQRILSYILRPEEAPKQKILFSVWFVFLILIGLMIDYGAIQKSRSFRLWGCRAGMVAICGLGWLYALLGEWVNLDRLLVPAYLLFALVWLYRRIIREPLEGKNANGGYGLVINSEDARDDHSRGTGIGRSTLEISRLAQRTRQGPT